MAIHQKPFKNPHYEGELVILEDWFYSGDGMECRVVEGYIIGVANKRVHGGSNSPVEFWPELIISDHQGLEWRKIEEMIAKDGDYFCA